MDWRCGSSDKAFALGSQCLEFKPQSHLKKKREREREKGYNGLAMSG
jgi:hypothetical protein